MGKRGITVFKDYEGCAWAWALQAQEYGRARQSRMYFRGPVIYSYGDHFPLAVFRNTPSRGRVVIVNASSYSHTTSRHQGEVRHALSRADSHNAAFWASTRVVKSFVSQGDFVVSCAEFFLEARYNAKELLAKAKRARSKRSDHLQEALCNLQNSNRLAEYFGLDRPFVMSTDTSHAATSFALALLDGDFKTEWLIRNATKEAA